MNGERIYLAAISLTDKHRRRFCDMLSDDLLVGEIERQYFIDDYADLPVMGWNEFCMRMQEANQTEWLNKIIKLDEEVLLATMERQLLDAMDSGSKDTLDAVAKAVQGLVGRSKILSEQRGAAVANSEIIIRILESKHDADVGGDCEKLAKEGSNGGRTESH